MAGHPAKFDCFMACGQVEQPVLDLTNKGVGGVY